MKEFSQWTGILVSIITLIIYITDKKLIQEIYRNQAFSEDRAIHLSPTNMVSKWRLLRIFKKKEIAQSRTGKYYIDSNSQPNQKRQRIIRIAVVVIPLMVVFGTLFFQK